MNLLLSVKKMHEELDYWIHIGIGDDIIRSSEHRPEYQHLVQRSKPFASEDEQIPGLVLSDLESQLLKPFFLRPTFWMLIWLKVKFLFRA